MVSYIYPNLQENDLVSVTYTQNRNSQGHEKILAPSAKKQTVSMTQSSQNTISSNHHKVLGIKLHQEKIGAIYIYPNLPRAS